MDPNVTYDLMTAAWRAGDYEQAWEHAGNLHAWLTRGGYAPTCVPADLGTYMVNAIYRYYRPAQQGRAS